MIVLPSFQLATRWNSQNRNENEFINELGTLIWLWILVFRIGIFEFRPHVNVVFDFISVPYTITDLQAPETL